MTPFEFKRQKEKEKEELKSGKLKPYVKISNSLLECFVIKKNITALKVIFYLGMKADKIIVNDKFHLTTMRLHLNDLCETIKTDKPTLMRNLKKMQETAITFLKDNEVVEQMSIIPRIEYKKGEDIIIIDCYNKVIELIKDVGNRFTRINVQNLVNLKSINTIKIIGLLKIIDGYSENVAKKKTYFLEELNGLFETNYKRVIDFERKILKPVQEELDNESSLTFTYNFEYEQDINKVGRPKAEAITILLLTNKHRQLTIF